MNQNLPKHGTHEVFAFSEIPPQVFPLCVNYQVRVIDWRKDRYAIFGPDNFVVSGLTSAQTTTLMSHLKAIESKQ